VNDQMRYCFHAVFTQNS